MWDASVHLSFLWTIFSMSTSLFYWGSPRLDTMCQLWPHQCWIERQDLSFWPVGSTPAAVWNNRLSTARAPFWLLFNLESNRTGFQLWESSRVGVGPIPGLSPSIFTSLFHIFCNQVPHLVEQWVCIFPNPPSVTYALTEIPLFLCHCCAANSMWALAFLINLWNLNQYFRISPKLQLLASTSCVRPLSLTRNSSFIDTGVLLFFCLSSYLLGRTSLRHGVGDSWTLVCCHSHRSWRGWHPPWGPWSVNVNQRAWSTCCSWSAGLQQAPNTTSTLSGYTQEIQAALH